MFSQVHRPHDDKNDDKVEENDKDDNDDIFISALGLDRPRLFAKTSRTLRASAAMVMETMRTTTMTRVSQPQ